MDSLSLTVVIVNYNGGTMLSRCVASVLADMPPAVRCVVVDNASSDSSLDHLPSDPWLELTRNQQNVGFAAAMNQAVDACDSEWVLALNPDTEVSAGFWQVLGAQLEAHSEAACLGLPLVKAVEPALLDGAGDRYTAIGLYWRGMEGQPVEALPNKAMPVFATCAAAALYKRDVWQRLGGMDADFFCYGEDVDLGFRLQLAGEIVLQLPSPLVAHHSSGITGRTSDFSIYHGFRNRLWVFVKNMPGLWLWLMLPGHALMQLALLLRACLRGHGRPALRGLRDGLRGLPACWRKRRSVRGMRRVSYRYVMRRMHWPWQALWRR